MEGLRKIEAELRPLMKRIEELQKEATQLVPLAAKEIRAKHETLFVLYAKQSKFAHVQACCVSKEAAQEFVQLNGLAGNTDIVEKATKDMQDSDLIHIVE